MELQENTEQQKHKHTSWGITNQKICGKPATPITVFWYYIFKSHVFYYTINCCYSCPHIHVSDRLSWSCGTFWMISTCHCPYPWNMKHCRSGAGNPDPISYHWLQSSALHHWMFQTHRHILTSRPVQQNQRNGLTVGFLCALAWL